MTELIDKLYYMVEDWVGQHDLQDEAIKNLEARQEALQDKITLRLGEDGQDMMEALSNLNLKLETIHDQALFRAAMRLGAQIAQPGRGNGWPGPQAGRPRWRTALPDRRVYAPGRMKRGAGAVRRAAQRNHLS